MVIKRQCSFCAGEVEPGTGMMFVKRDGTVFHFCSGSCRKQQLNLGRVGHRVRWTRAHALKRELAATSSAGGAGKSKPGSGKKVPTPAAPAPSVPSAPAADTPATPKPAKSKGAKPKN
jgi:large subunit ribosomal protein L24e